MKTLGPAMSDLTTLNPTPHAIAVYASQPLSPVATQHSLPSRTLPFTWAGLSPAGSHQLCLAHSFDHLVRAQEKRLRDCQVEPLGGLKIHDKLEFSRLFNRYVAGFRAAQNPIHVIGRAPEQVRVVRTVRHETSGSDKIAGTENRWQPRAQCQLQDAREIGDHQLVDRDVKRVGSSFDRLERGSDILRPLDHERRDFDVEYARCGLRLAHFQDRLRIADIKDDAQPV